MRSTLISCALFVAVSSCHSCEKKSVEVAPAPVATTPPSTSTFWAWLTASEVELASATVGEDPVHPMTAIDEKLKAVNSGLIAELLNNREPGAMQTLVISADGNPKLFSVVKAVVDSAPPLTRFKVVAFRPRRSTAAKLTLEGKEFSVADFQFRELGRSEGKLDIEILVKGLTAANTEEDTRVAFLLLDAALGEYDTETKLGEIRLSAMPAEWPANAKPLGEIAEAVDSL